MGPETLINLVKVKLPTAPTPGTFTGPDLFTLGTRARLVLQGSAFQKLQPGGMDENRRILRRSLLALRYFGITSTLLRAAGAQRLSDSVAVVKACGPKSSVALLAALIQGPP